MSELFLPLAQAMLLAAGRGNRMRPLTDTTPKPLLPVHGKPLLEWPMRALAAQGFARVLVNTGWLGEQIPAHFGKQHAHGDALPATQLLYSREEQDFGRALETAGGIARALPQLEAVFWLAAGDVFAPDFAFARADYDRFAASPALAHIWLVPNPPHNPAGDFALGEDGTAHVANEGNAKLPRYTYSTIGLYKRAFFAPPLCDIALGNPHGVAAPLGPLLRRGMDAGCVSAELYQGHWTDVGTPQRLAALNAGHISI